MTIQEALNHPNVVRFDIYGGSTPKIASDEDLIRLVKELPPGVRVFAVMDSEAKAEIRS